MIILFIYAYIFAIHNSPTFRNMGRLVPEGYLTSCTFDYMGDTPAVKAFVAYSLLLFQNRRTCQGS